MTVLTDQEKEVTTEKKFAIDIAYNGVQRKFHVEPDESIAELLKKAIAAFNITQGPHLLSLYREDGSLVPETATIKGAGLKPDEELILRQNAVKGGGLLRVAADVLLRSFLEFRRCGKGRTECAVYWIGPPEEDVVDSLEHPTHEISRYGYQIKDRWLTDFSKRLAKSNRSVKAQVHTHPCEAFHSVTDDQWPIVSQAGFVSIVIPNFAAQEPSLQGAWIGRLQADGTWQQLVSAGEAVLIV
ncbi:MAG: hypothetical protein ACJ71Q_00255 [Terriglobales bacterium]